MSTCGANNTGDSAIDARMEHCRPERWCPCWPPERRLVDAGYRTPPFPAEEFFPTPSFALTALWTLPELLGYLRSATSRFRAEWGEDPVLAPVGPRQHAYHHLAAVGAGGAPPA